MNPFYQALKVSHQKVNCSFCPRNINRCNRSVHENACKNNPKKVAPKITICHCKFCGKEHHNKNSKTNHQRYCKLNPNKEISQLKKLRDEGKLKSWNKGKHTGINTWKGKDTSHLRGKTTPLYIRDKISLKMKKNCDEGYLPKGCGRCKKYKYSSPIAGNVSLDGTWELKVARWLDKQKYSWKRNTDKFPYANLAGRKRTYTPISG